MTGVQQPRYISAQDDALGDAYLGRFSAEERRHTGSTYTPSEIVNRMVAMVADFQPDTVVDCGCGSGRFAIACARAFPSARIIAVDSSPEACALCANNAERLGLDGRIEVIRHDFLEFELPAGQRGRVLWIGNPPYVRHHDISPKAKSWFKATTSELGFQASTLAGLHAYFLAKIAQQWAPQDRGVLITSAEWLDVNYGAFMRWALTDLLGLDELHVFSKTVRVFNSAETTAAICSFGGGSARPLVSTPEGSRRVGLEELRGRARWSGIASCGAAEPQPGLVPLGSIASVHRGVVTGNNRFWVRSASELSDVPAALTTPIVSHAREISGACTAQTDPSSLARLITLPPDLQTLTGSEEAAARAIIQAGTEAGVPNGYVASHRNPWWSVTPPKPPAIMMTYMARRPPTFVVNRRHLPMLNVVHGIYPKVSLSQTALERLADYLNESVETQSGRTYCGGLTKFEPREAEALLVPPPAVLEG